MFQSQPGVLKSEASLQSWLVTTNEDQWACLSFYYFMNGCPTTSLSVQVEHLAAGLELETIWKLSGNQEPDWIMGSVPLPPLSSFSVYLLANNEDSQNKGDVALDDLKFHQSEACQIVPSKADPGGTPTPPPVATTSTTESTLKGIDCDFESNNLCQWTSASTGNLSFQVMTSSKSVSGPSQGSSGSHFAGIANLVSK